MKDIFTRSMKATEFLVRTPLLSFALQLPLLLGAALVFGWPALGLVVALALANFGLMHLALAVDSQAALAMSAVSIALFLVLCFAAPALVWAALQLTVCTTLAWVLVTQVVGARVR